MTINTVIKHHNAHSSRTMRGLNYLRQTEQKYTRAFRLMCPSFNLHTFDNWPGQQQLLLQHVYPRTSPLPHTVPQIVGIFIVRQFAWLGRLEGRLFILSHWEHNKTREKERERERKREHGTADDQSFPGNRMKMTMPGIRPGVRERERARACCKFNIEIKV